MQPKIHTAEEHHIRENLIDPDALQVLNRLQDAGYDAYLVGGGVRDLLMNRQPKDFDISTSARPEEVKDVFGRQCLLIGRRFRLAHVRFGKNIIEVATFRAGSGGDELIVRDNEWGTPEEDALRRDFTINGLFYDPSDHKIIDYVGGYDDLQKHCLRSIGKPAVRFKQDPVRMIRALKFRARFGYNIEPDAIKAIEECKEDILKSAAARLLEELLRMLESGSSAPFIKLLSEHGLMQFLFPLLGEVLESDLADRVYSYLAAADEWILEGGSPDRATLTASLLFPLLEKVIEVDFANSAPTLGDVHFLSQNLVHELLVDVHPRFTRRMCHDVAFILETQYRLTPTSNRKYKMDRVIKLAEFPLAVQFLKLRVQVEPELAPHLEPYESYLKVHYIPPKPIRRRRRR